ncbi:MAG: hypothetical protein MJZ60_08375 [Bacteroidaceae bacterium]|nr:hypothetical protein [Bacteroidaceae bacterium]
MSQLEELEAEVQRIRAKRNRGFDREKVRQVLNVLFILLAAIGLVMYFTHEEGDRMTALYVIGAAMLLKIIEFVLRFTA